MARIEAITMSMREIDRLKMVQAVIDGSLKPMLCNPFKSYDAPNSETGEPVPERRRSWLNVASA